MRPAELVALYAAHGIDFEHVAGSESDTHGIARKRRMRPEERRRSYGRPIVETADGAGTRSMRPRAWSHAEVGMGAFGVPRMPWLAACYSFAGDRTGYKELHRGLTLRALECAKSGNWAWQVDLIDGRPAYYLERLTELVLDAEGCAAYFTEAAKVMVRESPYAIYMGVSEAVWQKVLYGKFLEIQGKYQAWLNEATGLIGRWLRVEDLHETPERATVASEPSNATYG